MNQLRQVSAIFILVLAMSQTMQAQTSQAFKYQAVARNNNGNPISNQLVGIRISILEFTITGNPVMFH